MTDKQTGGPAFPVQSVYIEDQETNSHGMTLRDYFAAKAMAICPLLNATDKAEWAYKMADAMLKARNGNS